ncbi:MAG: exodeoxyribonuclease VII small subunit [Parcubacteria group bacterium]|nr:exodeoxyribonuclease VII small subunit [Parcubacteria group bacterium]|tara:strand:+ start:1496 stop:1705 length:210 start_codon:yes stop_codon:yes gene_type:complete
MPNKKKSFAQQYADLEKITEWFETEDVDLEEALKKFEDGLGLVKDLKSHLNKIENKVVDIKKQFKDVLD